MNVYFGLILRNTIEYKACMIIKSSVAQMVYWIQLGKVKWVYRPDMHRQALYKHDGIKKKHKTSHHTLHQMYKHEKYRKMRVKH